MKTVLLNAVILLALVSPSLAQDHGSDIYWHIDPSVKSCSMVIDPTLTQEQWKTFVKQVSAISSFKTLGSAEPLGKMHFAVELNGSRTPVDQHDLAWINTFTHPDADCPLGDVISVPTLRARMGVTEDMDIGAYWITAPNANYGMVGGEIKYRFLQETEKLPTAAVRVSTTILTGVPDFDLDIYSLDLIASKKVAMLTPYLGLRGSLAVGTETTTKVNLDTESLVLPQGYAGVSYSVWMLALAVEYNVASVNSVAMAVGLTF